MLSQSNRLKSASKSLKFFAKKKHFDLAAMIFPILLILTIEWAIYSAVTKKEEFKKEELLDLWAFTATTMGLIFTAKNIHDQQHLTKLVRASEYIEEWYSKDFFEIVKNVRKIKQEEFDILDRIDTFEDSQEDEEPKLLVLKKIVGGLPALADMQTKVLKRLLENRKENDEVDRILCFFEQMGEDIKLGAADEEYLKDFFYIIVINYYEIFRKYIEFYQYKGRTKTIYCNFVYLAQTWEKDGCSPELPLICERRWIITPEDKKLEESFKESSSEDMNHQLSVKEEWIITQEVLEGGNDK